MYTSEEIKEVVDKSISIINLKKEPQELYKPLEHTLSIGGKRIRPRLCLLCCSLFSKRLEKCHIYPAMAIELFHAFTLIHDDIMDNADKRRGQLTIHKKWGENTAILSGDVMSIIAYEYLAEAKPELLPKALVLFTKTAREVCEGQQFDMNYEKIPYITMDDYIKMIGLKTAVLIAFSAKLGALLAGADDETANALYNYGYQLGIAFQITDDYLDVYADHNTFGKNIGGDIVNNKKSWMQVECIKQIQGEGKDRFNKIMAMGAERAEEKITLMKELYSEYGIKEAAEKEIEKYYSSAMSELKDLSLSRVQLKLLSDFATDLINRNK